jgi:indolepyruvate ferredoxin oxidoreductase beta subunit
VLALQPGVGDVDVLLASELMEAGRMVAAGFVTQDRTLAIASTARFHVMDEKIAIGDGRYDASRLTRAITEQSRARLLIDMDAVARAAGSMVNAVMLGALAGGAQLPISVEAYAAAIRRDGKAVEANLRGFQAGLDAARAARPGASAPKAEQPGTNKSTFPDLEREIDSFPAAARDVMREGVRRLVRYQDVAYARRYLERLRPIAAADAGARTDGRLLAETARHLALRMSYEDVVRVAQAKIDPARFARIAAETGAQPREPVIVTEFLKPGVEELCSLLPPSLARRVLAWASRRGLAERLHWGMELKSTSVSGFLRLWLLAKLRAWRPRSHRFAQEQEAIDAWLGLIALAATRSGELALEVAECARLIKGYGDTFKRGSDNYQRIVTELVTPALDGPPVAAGGRRLAPSSVADAVASARTAALVDPDGEALTRCLAEVAARGVAPIAAE